MFGEERIKETLFEEERSKETLLEKEVVRRHC